jgi:hypothetical protein
MKNPWMRPAPEYYPVKEIQSVSVVDRIDELKSFDSSKLKAVIKYPGTQKTVRARAVIFLARRGINADKSGS